MKITKEQTNALKGIAILTVIIAHGNILSKSFDLVPVLKNVGIVSIITQGGMCLFLMLSGYGLFLSYSSNGLKNFWDNKFIKIFLPAILAQIVWLPIFNVLNSIFGRDIKINWSTLFGDLVCVNPLNALDGSIWYMSYLLFCYIFFYCIFGFIKKPKVAMAVFSVLWIVLLPIMLKIWLYNYYCITAFAVGVWMAAFSNRKSITENTCVRVIAAILCVAIGVGYYFVFRQNIFVDNIASVITAFAFILLIGFVNVEKCRALNFIGRHSFAMYIFQGKIMFGWFPYENYSASIKLIVYIILFFVNMLVAVAFDKAIKLLVNKINK